MVCVCGAWPPAGDHIAVRGHGDIHLVLTMERVELGPCVDWLNEPQNFETAVTLETES